MANCHCPCLFHSGIAVISHRVDWQYVFFSFMMNVTTEKQSFYWCCFSLIDCLYHSTIIVSLSQSIAHKPSATILQQRLRARQRHVSWVHEINQSRTQQGEYRLVTELYLDSLSFSDISGCQLRPPQREVGLRLSRSWFCFNFSIAAIFTAYPSTHTAAA